MSPRLDHCKYPKGFVSPSSTGLAAIFIKQEEEDDDCRSSLPIQSSENYQHGNSTNLQSRAVSLIQYSPTRNAKKQFLPDENQRHSSAILGSMEEKDFQLMQPSEQIPIRGKGMGRNLRRGAIN